MVQSFGKWEKTLTSGCYFLKANPKPETQTPNPKPKP